jgi:hypothetical protein
VCSSDLYLFSGEIVDEREHPLPQHPGWRGKRIEFSQLK